MRIQNTTVPFSSKNQYTSKTSNPFNYTAASTLDSTLGERSSQPSTDTVPTYQISQEQVDELKERYDLQDISKEDFNKLMNELKELGIVSERDSKFFSKTSSGGVEYTQRPIVLGLFKQETTEQFFNYKAFEQGDPLDWVSKMIEQNELAIDWLSNSENSLNDKMQDFKNTAELKQYNQDLRRLSAVLNEIK